MLLPSAQPGARGERRPRYALSAATCATGSRSGMRRTVRVHLGIHQLASPNSFMSAGTSSARITVASKMIPPGPLAEGARPGSARDA